MEAKNSPYIKHIYVCTHQREAGKSCCADRGAERVLERLKSFVQENNLKGKVRVNRSGCLDFCEQGITAMVYPDNRWYSHVTLETVGGIIEEHLAPLANRYQVQVPGTKLGGNGIKAFLFDLGNVLVRFDHLQAAKKITAGTQVDPQNLFKLFFESPLVIEHDTGKISTEEFYEKVKQALGLALPYERFLDVWNDIFTGDERMADLVGDLVERFPCYLISNTNKPHFEYLRERHPILDRLRGHILSYEVGYLKPHPVIYQKALEMVGLPASEVFYVDDRPDLIEAGKGIGLQTHAFVGADSLIQELTSRGVLNGR